MYFNTTGEVLQETNKDKKPERFKDKKLKSIKLSNSFERIGEDKKAERIKNCGSTLKFKVCDKDNYKKLISADFCRERLCPMCNWRRSRKLYGDILQILHKVQEEKQYKFIFLTLTVRNCEPNEIKQTLDSLYKGINQFFKYKAIDKVVKGYVQVLEITKNKEVNTYHPHFHILIAVNPSYLKDRTYLNRETWANLWQKALKVDYTPIIDVQVVKAKKKRQGIESAVAETSKYTVKESDYISDDLDETDETVAVLSKALKHRRLISFGKRFKTIKAELKIQDVDAVDADLVQADSIGCNCPICGSDLREALYKWYIGLNNYVEVDNG